MSTTWKHGEHVCFIGQLFMAWDSNRGIVNVYSLGCATESKKLQWVEMICCLPKRRGFLQCALCTWPNGICIWTLLVRKAVMWSFSPAFLFSGSGLIDSCLYGKIDSCIGMTIWLMVVCDNFYQHHGEFLSYPSRWVIGSLSEPHTSATALCICVYAFVCLDRVST